MTYNFEDVNHKGKLIDLHSHSTNSDGEQSPEEVIHCAKEAGLSAIAITDHNVLTYTKPFVREGVQVIPGIELSAEYYVPAWEETTEIHVVGIFPNGVNASDFEAIFSEIGDGKEAYIRAILEDLATRNIHITMDEVIAARSKGKHIGRHDIARVLAQKGIEKDIEAAFDNQIGNFSPYYIPSTRYIHYASLREIIHQVIASGGIPILAHPYGYSMNEKEIELLIEEFSWLVRQECSGGFESTGTLPAGMEVYYEKYLTEPEHMKFLKHMQTRYGLLASAGGDRHREGQPFCTGGSYDLLGKLVAVLRYPRKVT